MVLVRMCEAEILEQFHLVNLEIGAPGINIFVLANDL
jgi:hypothetical protein